MTTKTRLEKAIERVNSMTPQEFEDFIIRNDPTYIAPSNMTSASFSVYLSTEASNESPYFLSDYVTPMAEAA